MTKLIDIKPVDAQALLQSNKAALLIDIRTSMEYMFVGHPVGAVHIPWLDEPDWEINPNFVKQIKRQIEKKQESMAQVDTVPVLLICRSGQRTLEAGKVLLAEGVEGIYNILGGFEGDKNDIYQRSSINGWRYDGLAWEQS